MSGNERPFGASLKITGGQLLDGHGVETSNKALLIRGGRIAATGEAAEQADADQTFNADGCLITPGFVDLYCNLREPGNGQKGNIASETRAAARGGFTTVCVSPETSPVNDSRAVTHLIRDAAVTDSPIRVLPVGAVTRGLDGPYRRRLYCRRQWIPWSAQCANSASLYGIRPDVWPYCYVPSGKPVPGCRRLCP